MAVHVLSGSLGSNRAVVIAGTESSSFGLRMTIADEGPSLRA